MRFSTGTNRRMTRENWIVVIASVAKRSRASRTEDGLLRCARNDSSSPQAGAEALDSLAGILQLGVGGRIGCRFVRIPTKSVTDSDLNPAMCSDLKSARIPI